MLACRAFFATLLPMHTCEFMLIFLIDSIFVANDDLTQWGNFSNAIGGNRA